MGPGASKGFTHGEHCAVGIRFFPEEKAHLNFKKMTSVFVGHRLPHAGLVNLEEDPTDA